MPPRRRGERRDERLSRIGFAAGGVPGVNALFCRALARGCQKKGLTLGGRTRMRVKERRSSGSFTPEAGGIQRPMAERPSHRWKEVGGVAGNSPLKWGAGDVWLTRGEKAFSPGWTCVLIGLENQSISATVDKALNCIPIVMRVSQDQSSKTICSRQISGMRVLRPGLIRTKRNFSATIIPMADDATSHRGWQQFNTDHPDFPALYHKLFKLVPKLICETAPAKVSDNLVLTLMEASLPDFDDILLLCSSDRLWSALKLLRSLYERTVTLKYLAQNKTEIDAFLEYDAVDWQEILSGIEKQYQMTPGPEALKHVADKSKQIKSQFKRCKKCGLPRQTWTTLDSQSMAKKVGLGYLHFECFKLPSKFIHPTYFGADQVSKDQAAPIDNILKSTHILTLETVLTHQRYFHSDPIASTDVIDVIRDFLNTWKFSKTDFGLAEHAQRAGLVFVPDGLKPAKNAEIE